jgi:hypothetical protein
MLVQPKGELLESSTPAAACLCGPPAATAKAWHSWHRLCRAHAALLPAADSTQLTRCTSAQGYNATVLAYGQTGSGKTHTMSGGVGIRGIAEEGITCRVANHVFAILDVIKTKQKPGDKIQVGVGGCWHGASAAALCGGP